jgi:hypothetical protein
MEKSLIADIDEQGRDLDIICRFIKKEKVELVHELHGS